MPRFDPDSLDARDPAAIRALLPVLRRFNRGYLRLRVSGLEHVPRAPAMFVGNHNGGIVGADLAATLGTLWDLLGPEAPLYALAHDFAMRQATPLGRLIAKAGAVRACPENVGRVLASGGQVLVYPGGDLEAYRHSRLRDEIILGARTGFVRAAQRAQVPLVPIVAHGAHRSAYIFHDGEAIARRLGLSKRARVQRFPLALALPWGLALGPWLPYLPLPFPVSLRILPSIVAAPDDDPAEVKERVRASMQRALSDLAREAAAS